MEVLLMRRLTILLAIAIAFGIMHGCLDDVEKVPLEVPAEIPTVWGLSAKVDDRQVLFSWAPVGGIDGYQVYRKAGEFGGLIRVTSTQDTFYLDTGLTNGQPYYYSVSAVKGGIEGRRSYEILAVPSPYSLVINGGVGYTSSTTVNLTLNAPPATVAMKVSNVSTLSDAVWEGYSPEKIWNIGEGDGVKTVYVMFQDESGAESKVISATITLDTYAMIHSLSITPQPPLYDPGSLVHFSMEVADDETGGAAWVLLEGYGENIQLYDNGRGGDGIELDGIYEADFQFPISLRGTDLTVTGNFVDRVGNKAPVFEAGDRITFTDPPDAVVLVGVDDSTTSSITIRWVASEEEHFNSYRIYRNTIPGVTENSVFLIRELFNQQQTLYPDGELKEGQTYYYRLFVVNDLDETAGSNEIAGSTFNAIPEAVVLDTLTSVGTDRVTLTWSRNYNTDFREYRVYRSTSPGVTTSSTLVTTINDQEITHFDDEGIDLIMNDYYYRIYVFDLGGNNSRSNEVSTAD